MTTICPHIFWDNKWWSYEPFVREMNVWAELFEELVMIAPLEMGPPPELWSPYEQSECISVVPFWKNRGHGLVQPKVGIGDLPGMLWSLTRSAAQCDAYHLRSPGNISLLASLLVPVWSKKICAKYAGIWPHAQNESISYRLQKRILASRWFSGPVTVYGEWTAQPAHIKPFFTSIMDTGQVRRAKSACQQKQLHAPLRVIFVGRLTRSKNVHVLLDALRIIRGKGFAHESRIIGDGPELPALQRQTADLQLSNAVTFMGGLAFEEVLAQYEWADMLVLASETEGWPKAIAEAMAFGLICIGSNRGLVPQMLAEGRGLLVEPGDEAGLASALQEIAVGKVNFSSMSRKASEWAQRYSLGGLRQAIRDLLIREWCLTDADLRTLP
ncbi:MAG: glycosyltransferase family 4 protein [Chloroflexi bacterium]|nr:glycosyltransferase family 4 protein [Chloroflexota bacterium]